MKEIYQEIVCTGPTLRDQFAMAALTGYLTSVGVVNGHYPPDDDLARYAYEAADAMMKAREVSDE